MKKIIKALLVLMALALVVTAFVACEEEEPSCAHQGGKATCTEAPVCELCGESYGAALGHKGGTSTCTALGICATCGEEYGELKAHTPEYYADEYFCDKEGLSAGASCSVCGTVLRKRFPLDPLGHVMSEGTCTEDSVCLREGCDHVVAAPGHAWEEVEALDPTCTEVGYTAHKACACGEKEGYEEVSATGHNYVYGICSGCEETDPTYVDYYLVGWINGADYGCQADWENLGVYKFVDGKLTAHFEGDCYVFVKTGNLAGENVKWYLFGSYVEGKEGVLAENNVEKMKLPGGVDIELTLTVNEDGTLTLVADYHIHAWTNVEALDPTCTEAGHTAYKACECGEKEGYEEVAATGHTYVEDVCSACGAAAPSDVPALVNAVLDCTTKDNRVSFSTEEQVWSQNGITLTLKRGEGTAYSDKAPITFGSKGSLTIEGSGIKTIVIETGNTTYGTYVSGCFNGQPGVASVSAKTGTVTIVLSEEVDSFTIENLAKQGQIKTITINPQ